MAHRQRPSFLISRIRRLRRSNVSCKVEHAGTAWHQDWYSRSLRNDLPPQPTAQYRTLCSRHSGSYFQHIQKATYRCFPPELGSDVLLYLACCLSWRSWQGPRPHLAVGGTQDSINFVPHLNRLSQDVLSLPSEFRLARTFYFRLGYGCFR